MIAGGLALAFLAGPVGISLFASLAVCNTMIGVGLTTALAGTVGLLSPTPQQPSSLSPQGQLPVNAPNPLWRQVYGLFQFGGAVTFIDGPILDWVGTLANEPCENQYMHTLHTLTSHQIAGFVAVVIDGQTFNFGTDLVMLTESNYWIESGGSGINAGPPGSWGFINPENPWCGAIWFEFSSGNGYDVEQQFPSLLAGATMPIGSETFTIGSPKWTAACLQRGRAGVHIGTHYEPYQNESQGGNIGAPKAYVLGSGRIPTVEFKILGRIITDYRIETAWQPSTSYPQYSYVLAIGPIGTINVFVQTAATGTSGSSEPSFLTTGFGTTVSDGGCTWLNCGWPVFALNNGQNENGTVGASGDFASNDTFLNDPTSIKLVNNILMADAWRGNYKYGTFTSGLSNSVIEAPIGYLQYASGSVGTSYESGTNEPSWSTTQGGTTSDGAVTWICLGRSPYATCLPDSDGTQNQGGFANPSLVIADYLTTPKNLFGLGAALTSDSIDSIVAAANICDEPVAIEVFSDNTTLYERSYACNGCFDSSSAYGDVLKALALSMAGYVVPPGDCWRVYAGSWVPPEITLGDADVRAPIKADIRLSTRDTCNGVKGQYIPGFLPINPLGSLSQSPSSPAWKKVDFPPVQRANYIEEDGGIILWKDITLDFTISLWMAQRIARIVLERLRRQVTVSLPAKATPLRLLAGDTVTYVHPRWQTADPPMPTTFFVSHLAPRVEEGHDGAPAIGVDLVLRQTDANVYVFQPPSSPTNYGDYSPYGQTGVGAGNVE